MQITLDAKALTCALAVLRKAAGVLHAPLTCKHILVTADAGDLRLEATDLEQHMLAKLPARVALKGSALLPMAGLLAAVKGYKGDVRITNGLVECGDRAIDLVTLPVSDWPQMLAPFDEAKRWSMPAADLATVLGRVAPFQSTEETRYYLNGVLFETGKEGLTLVATDGHRLAAETTPCTAPAGVRIIVPSCAVATLQAALKGAEGTAQIEATDTRIRVVLGRTAVTSKLIDGSFPEYDRCVPGAAEVVSWLAIDAAYLSTTAEALIAGMDRHYSRPVKLELTGSSMTATAGDAEQGVSKMRLNGATAFTGAPVVIGFAGDQLRSFARAAGGRLTIGMASDYGPARITTTAAPAWLGVLMPHRV